MQNLISKLCIVCILAGGLITRSYSAHCNYSLEHPTTSIRPEDPPSPKPYLPNMEINTDLKDLIKIAATLYKDLDKSVCKTTLKFDVFAQAYIGMVNLKTSQIIDKHSGIITIVDYSLSANVPRLWVIDLKKKKILYNTLVSHGQGSGEEYAVSFSNRENSHQTSLGFFLTDTTYYGRNGYSLRLHGLDMGYNDRALERAIVIHGAPYVSEKFIEENQRLGRSWGCPALPEELNAEIIDLIKEGTLFFGYYPDPTYLTSSIWLNRHPQKTNQIPTHTMTPHEMTAQNPVDSTHQHKTVEQPSNSL